MRGVLLWLAALALAAYLALTTALWLWLERRPFNQVTWVDAVLAPVRWEEIRLKRGTAFIEEGLADFGAQRWAEGSMKLRVGLQRQPDHWRARLQLVEFYLALGTRDRATALIRAGLERNYPGRVAMQQFLGLWTAGEELTLAREMIDQALGHEGSLIEADRLWLAEQAAILDLRRGETGAVLAWAETRALADPLAGELRVLAWLGDDRPDEALRWIDTWRAAGGDPARVARLEVRAAREAGNLDRLETAWETLRRLTPSRPEPYVYGVVQRAMADSPRTVESLEDYLFRFGSRVEHINLLVEPLMQIMRPDLLARLDTWAVELGLASEMLRLAAVQARLAEADWVGADTALRTLDEWRAGQEQRARTRLPGASEPPRLPVGALVWEQAARQTLMFLLDPSEAHQQALLDWMRRNARGLTAFQLVLRWLEQAEQWRTASGVVGLAQRHFPAHQGLREQLGRYEEALAGVTSRTAREHEFQRDPDAPVVDWAEAWRRETVVMPETEREVMAELARRLDERDGDGVLQLIRQVNQTRPAWLPARGVDFLRAEVRAQMVREDRGALASTVRRFLDGSNPRGLEAMRWLEELEDGGRRGDAEAILAEVWRQHPEFPPARRVQARWQAEATPVAEEP